MSAFNQEPENTQADEQDLKKSSRSLDDTDSPGVTDRDPDAKKKSKDKDDDNRESKNKSI
ncbi:hypothetical protein NIES4071_09130 [Calothrix sp. NIES-4071]|nr:hypothetical protein NIES4071_09130 [Calothrix sp. NIES-4071]BAZ55255.1 hypothetical protein NIES4105_09090 [Calothrix sp. NIES-4105]